MDAKHRRRPAFRGGLKLAAILEGVVATRSGERKHHQRQPGRAVPFVRGALAAARRHGSLEPPPPRASRPAARRAGAARFLVSTRLGGFRVRYEERPAGLVERERLKFVRVLRGGPVRSIEMQIELGARGGGTDVTRLLRIAPRWPMMYPWRA
jgi:hypothetical protein